MHWLSLQRIVKGFGIIGLFLLVLASLTIFDNWHTFGYEASFGSAELDKGCLRIGKLHRPDPCGLFYTHIACYFGGPPSPGERFMDFVSPPSLHSGSIDIPLGLPSIICSAIVALQIWRPWRRHPIGHCPTCGYDLQGTVSAVCSECGQPVQRIDADQAAP